MKNLRKTIEMYIKIADEEVLIKKNGRAIYVNQNGKYKQATNFSIKIEEEHSLLNGNKEVIERYIIIAVLLKGKITKHKIIYSDFTEFKWIINLLGIDAEYNEKVIRKAGLLAIIKKLSPKIIRVVKVAKVGWFTDEEQQSYLHNEGAISADDESNSQLSACVDGALKNCCFPSITDNDDPQVLIDQVLDLANISEQNKFIGILGLAAVFRAPLTKFKINSLILFYVGLTGSFKTAVALVFQQFYGINFKQPPGNFSSTAKSIELLVSQAGNIFLVIDDFTAALQNKETAKMLESMIGGVGNNTVRGFALSSTKNADLSLIDPVILMTAESIPPLIQSRMDRSIFVVFEKKDVDTAKKGDIDIPTLTAMQKRAGEGDYAKVMSLYIKFLVKHHDKIEDYLNKQFEFYRDKAIVALTQGLHPRAPSNVADLMLGLDMFLKFCGNEKYLDDDRIEELKDYYFDALIDLMNLQPIYHQTTDIKSLIKPELSSYLQESNFRLYDLKGTKCNSTKYPKDFIGWKDVNNKRFYILAENGKLIIDNLPDKLKSILGSGSKTFWANLKRYGLLVEFEDTKNVVRKTINGKAVRVYSLCYTLIEN